MQLKPVSSALSQKAQPASSLRSVWFTIPVAANAVLQLLFQTIFVVYDGGATQTNALYFSLPYWVGVLFIGIRRWRHPTSGDALFFSFGQLASIIALSIITPNGPYE